MLLLLFQQLDDVFFDSIDSIYEAGKWIVNQMQISHSVIFPQIHTSIYNDMRFYATELTKNWKGALDEPKSIFVEMGISMNYTTHLYAGDSFFHPNDTPESRLTIPVFPLLEFVSWCEPNNQ